MKHKWIDRDPIAKMRTGFASLAHLVERLNCNQEGRGFDSFSWHHTSLKGDVLPLRLLFFVRGVNIG
jgi:hypothetical protein